MWSVPHTNHPLRPRRIRACSFAYIPTTSAVSKVSPSAFLRLRSRSGPKCTGHWGNSPFPKHFSVQYICGALIGYICRVHPTWIFLCLRRLAARIISTSDILGIQSPSNVCMSGTSTAVRSWSLRNLSGWYFVSNFFWKRISSATNS